MDLDASKCGTLKIFILQLFLVIYIIYIMYITLYIYISSCMSLLCSRTLLVNSNSSYSYYNLTIAVQLVILMLVNFMFYVCMWVDAHVCKCTKKPETVVTGSCDRPTVGAGSQVHPLEEWHMLLMTEPLCSSFNILNEFFRNFLCCLHIRTALPFTFQFFCHCHLSFLSYCLASLFSTALKPVKSITSHN